MALNYAKTVKAMKRGKSVAGKLHKYFALILAAFIALVIGSAYLYWKLERGGEGNLGEAIWTIMFTLIGQGEFAQNPITVAGRVIVFLLSIIGISMLGVVLSEVLTRIMKYNLNNILGLNKCKYQHHTIICGWNSHADLVIQELLAAGKQIAVISPTKPAELDKHEVFFVAGDPTNDEILKQAGVANADAAIILAVSGQGLDKDDIDARTILTGLAIESINSKVYTVAELIAPKNAPHAKRANIDDTIYAQTAIADITATAAAQQGTISFIADLLTGTGGTRLCAAELGQEWEGKTVGELFSLARENGDLPIGLISPKTPTKERTHKLNPPETQVITLPQKIAYITRLTKDQQIEPIKEDADELQQQSRNVIICGWNSHAMNVISELRAAGDNVAVIAPQHIAELEGLGIKQIQGLATDEATLKESGAKEAASAIILATDAENLPPSTVDAKTILTGLTIETLNHDIYTVAEILRPENHLHAKRAKIDTIIPCEPLLARYIALCASEEGISAIANDILSYSTGEMSLVALPLGKEHVGKTVGDVFAKLRTQSSLPLAILRKVQCGTSQKWVHTTNPSPSIPVQLPMKVICLKPRE